MDTCVICKLCCSLRVSVSGVIWSEGGEETVSAGAAAMGIAGVDRGDGLVVKRRRAMWLSVRIGERIGFDTDADADRDADTDTDFDAVRRTSCDAAPRRREEGMPVVELIGDRRLVVIENESWVYGERGRRGWNTN